MSGIKSDQWIREQCKVRKYWMERVNGSKWSLARHIQNEDEANLWKSRGHDVQQATAEDLKGLSVKLPMIEPFESGQVRTRSRLPSVDERVLISQAEYSQSIKKDGLIEEKIVSYGTSSYGYDIRCAPEFKVFTNVHSAVVDPKNFDDKSFVDINADSCVIPPNSFALARSLEYMRIPRDILVVCLGKSTYARCFSGNTKVALANGTSISLKSMAKRAATGERFFGYGISPKLGVVVTEFVQPRLVNSGEKLVRVTLDSGETIDCTPDHRFLTRKGMYVQAQHLEEGQSLMPLYRDVVRGREIVYNPDYKKMGSWWRNATYRLSDAWNIRNGVYEEGTNEHRHHKDEDKRNDYPTNIERKNSTEHVKDHNDEYFGDGFDPKRHSRSIKSTLKARKKNPEWVKKVSKISSEKAKKFWHPGNEKVQLERNLKIKESWSLSKKKLRSKQTTLLWKDPEYKAKMAVRASKPRTVFDLAVAKKLLKQTKSVKVTAEALGVTPRVLAWQLPEEVNKIRALKGLPPKYPTNHKVVSVVELKGSHDVYCLTSPETGNFALEAGVFVKNCGIIVNVTPLEPEWEGHITLEFSNTTPLPARIYANEGVAQLLFFQADQDDVCKTSYKDRNGKYQGQLGVTLPRG